MQIKFVSLSQPALVVATMPGYHVIKSKKGYSLANKDMQVISYNKSGIWFEEYALIGSHENIVWLMTGEHKTCMFNTDDNTFITAPAFI